MNIFRLFAFSEDKEFARELVKQLLKELPVDLMEKRSKVISVNKITRLLEHTYLRVGQYQQEKQRGFVRQAVLAYTFRWELKSHGYSPDFVNLATEGLVVELARIRKKVESN